MVRALTKKDSDFNRRRFGKRRERASVGKAFAATRTEVRAPLRSAISRSLLNPGEAFVVKQFPGNKKGTLLSVPWKIRRTRFTSSRLRSSW